MNDLATRSFTLCQANAMLPLIRLIVRDIVALSQAVEQTKRRIEYLKSNRLVPQVDDYLHELIDIERAMDRDFARLRELTQELIRLNVIADNVTAGFVDFPALRGEQPIRLCWAMDEAEVLHWHKPFQDCSRRQPVDQQLIAQFHQYLLSGQTE